MNDWSFLSDRKPIKIVHREHRLYYDQDGTPICYSMQELEHDYIVVTPEQFATARYDVKVIDKKIVYPSRGTIRRKLVKSDMGWLTDNEDICLPGKSQHWDLKYED